LSKARREDEQQNKLYQAVQDPNFKLDVRTALQYGPQGMAALKAQQEAAVAEQTRALNQSQIAERQARLPGYVAEAFDKQMKPFSSAAYNARNVDEGVASVKAMYANPPIAAVLTKIKSLEQAIADTTAAFGDPKTTDQWRQHWGGITPEKLFEAAQKNQDPLARAIAYRDSLPPGSPDYNAIQAKITQFENQNRVLNTVKGEFEDRRAPAPRGVVDPGIAQGVTPLTQAPSVDAAPAPVANNMTGAQPVNPRQQLAAFESKLELEKAGYRQTPQGNQEFIPGSKADPAAAYRNIVTTAAAKDDMTQITRAQSLPQDFVKIDETLNILRNTDINTGLGAELFTVLDKARAQVTLDKKAGKRAVNTEYLDALLGSDVFPQIQALGIGARGLDTPAERDYLRKVLTGSVSLSKDTLIKMTELRRKGLVSEAQRYNKRVEGGEFKNYAGATGRKVEAVTVPRLPTTEAKGAAPVKISGDAEYDKLPSGTLFIDPEGIQRRKP
jgi:hypothetical protein